MIGSILALGSMLQDEGAFWEEVQRRLKPLWIARTDAAPFVPPPAAELEALSAFAAGPPDAALPAALEQAGWRLDLIPFGDERLRLLRESPDAKRGRGMMLVRPAAAASTLVLMAPHRFFDRLTGDIARGVFFRAGASVLLENTAHRYWAREEGVEYGPSDAAHREATALHALAKGVAAGRKSLLIAQLHGFTEGAEKAGEAAAILSDGTREPGPAARKLAEGLRASKIDCRLYGPDTRRLGATENVLGRHLRGSETRFLHLEMTLPLREAFKADASPLSAALRAAAE